MILIKDNEIIEIENENTAAGFMANGWEEYNAPPSQEAKPRKRKQKEE